MSTEYFPYVDRVDDQRYQAVVLIHDIPERGRPRLERELIGEPQHDASTAMQLAMRHRDAMQYR